MGAAPGTTQPVGRWRSATPAGVYRPRRPRTSPLYRLIEDHFEEFATVYDELLARRCGYWRPVVSRVVEKYLACRILKHGFARVRCSSCKHEHGFLMSGKAFGSRSSESPLPTGPIIEFHRSRDCVPIYRPNERHCERMRSVFQVNDKLDVLSF